jgi:transposase
LYEGLTKAGFDVVLPETRHVKAALSAMIIKADRKDAPVATQPPVRP